MVAVIALLVCPPLAIVGVVVVVPLIAIAVVIGAVAAVIAPPVLVVRHLHRHRAPHAHALVHRLAQLGRKDSGTGPRRRRAQRAAARAAQLARQADVFAGELAAAALLVDELESVRQATGTNLAPYASLGLAAWRGDDQLASEPIEATRRDVVGVVSGSA